MKAFETEDISCGYGGMRVLNGLSFSVKEGECCGVIGPNGAGKTTLLRVMTRTLKPWRGAVHYRGNDIFALPGRSFAREVATMPLLPEIPFPFTAGEFVLMGRYPHLRRFETPSAEDWLIVEESLALTDTAALKDRRVSELSGGERQRVILAQALAQKPKVLFLDEPIAHLDVGHQAAILDLLARLNRDAGLTLVMVLHDLNMASEYCDTLVLLNEGRVFAAGTPREVLTYQNVEQVYKTMVIVKDNPLSSKPYVFIVPEHKK